jgi:hypothetical protein
MPVKSRTSAAISPARGWMGPISKPSSSCLATASTTNAGRCPNMLAPNPITKSTYSLPSTSQTLEPSDRVVTMGYTISFQSCLKPAAERGSARKARFSATSSFDLAVRRV